MTSRTTAFNDKKKVAKQMLVERIQEESKYNLMANLKEKMEVTTNHIVDLLNAKGEDRVNNIQILSLIAQKSLSEVAWAANSIGYAAHEIAIGFNLYLEMIGKINEIKNFPPTIESFTAFMGISRSTYNNWLVDYDRKEVMDYIHSYLLGVLATSSLTGELKEISSIYLQKTMGKAEQTAPVVIEHKKVTDKSEIDAQLAALKKDNIIEATYVEVGKDE